MTDIVDLALACYRKPLEYQDRFSLAAPQPAGMERLLWLANGSPETLEAEVRRTGARPQELRNAARFCVQQWCLARGADPYRVLGVEPGVSLEQIKEHYRLLIRLFHPDRGAGRETWTDHYASRINEAWAVLSRTSDRAPLDSRSYPSHIPIRDTVRPVAGRVVERTGPLSARDQPVRRFRARRRLPQLVWGGLALAVLAVLGGFYLDRFSVGQGGLDPAGAVSSAAPVRVTAISEPVAAAVEPGALAPLLAAPDWRALEQREQEVRRQAAQLRERRAQWEQTHQQRIVAEEALLESMRAERVRLEAQVRMEQARMEQARMEQARAERLAVERQRLARLQAEQARVEQVRTERELAERQRLDALQAEQTKAERLAEELRIERQRLEKLKAEQARNEQAKMERAQAERQRLEELKAERARAEQARLEATNRVPAVPVAVAGEDDLTVGELESLLNRYTQAYQRGDLNGVMALFATGARGRIQGDYATLFTTHYIRSLWLRDLRWLYRGSSASGSGHYELKLRRRDNGELRQVEGSIRFTVQKRDSQILIETIEYDWPES
ncbi:MAG: DnaJ domain-containing protein [Candidatus Contendobacter sp.]|nr:DnaJ domain-containing protein [Candidatus Contendobacter sp.]